MGSREDDSNRETRELALAQQEIEAKWTALKESNLRRAEALPSGNGGCYREHTYKLFNHGEFNEHSICTRCGYKNPYTQQGFSTGALNLLSSHSSCNRCNSKNTEQKIIVAGCRHMGDAWGTIFLACKTCGFVQSSSFDEK